MAVLENCIKWVFQYNRLTCDKLSVQTVRVRIIEICTLLLWTLLKPFCFSLIRLSCGKANKTFEISKFTQARVEDNQGKCVCDLTLIGSTSWQDLVGFQNPKNCTRMSECASNCSILNLTTCLPVYQERMEVFSAKVCKTDNNKKHANLGIFWQHFVQGLQSTSDNTCCGKDRW